MTWDRGGGGVLNKVLHGDTLAQGQALTVLKYILLLTYKVDLSIKHIKESTLRLFLGLGVCLRGTFLGIPSSSRNVSIQGALLFVITGCHYLLLWFALNDSEYKLNV